MHLAPRIIIESGIIWLWLQYPDTGCTQVYVNTTVVELFLKESLVELWILHHAYFHMWANILNWGIASYLPVLILLLY